MAWSPPARQRRSWLVEQAGDYATPNSHHIRDGTDASAPVEKSAGWSVAFPDGALRTAFGAYMNNTGLLVTPAKSLQSATVYACVKVLSDGRRQAAHPPRQV